MNLRLNLASTLIDTLRTAFRRIPALLMTKV